MENTYEDFLKTLDKLTEDYISDYEDLEIPILEFLDNEGIDREYLKNLNPLYIVSAIHDCDMEHGIFIRKREDYTARFKILMGFCEEIDFVQHPKPKFKTYDIIQNNIEGRTYVVMDFARDKDEDDIIYDYWIDDYKGRTLIYRQSVIESNFKKIGEVTPDVLGKFKKSNKDS